MMKPLRFFIMALLCAVTNVAWGETVTGIIYFGNNGTKIDNTSVTDKDNLGNDWTITITFSNNNYFSQSNDFSQVGSSNNPASTITFETELPTNQTIKNFEAKFGGFYSEIHISSNRQRAQGDRDKHKKRCKMLLYQLFLRR